MDHQGTEKKIKASSAHDSRKRTVIAITLSGALVLSAITAYYLHFHHKISDTSTATNSLSDSKDSTNSADSSSHSKVGTSSATDLTNGNGSGAHSISNMTGTAHSGSISSLNGLNDPGRTKGIDADSNESAATDGAPGINVATGLPVGTNAKVFGGINSASNIMTGGIGSSAGITPGAGSQENSGNNPNAISKEKAAEDARLALHEKAKNSCISAFFSVRNNTTFNF